MLKLKAFIYRFSAVFGLLIYLADKEEQAYINSMPDMDEFSESIHRGLWQADKGFTTVWTGKMPWYKSFCVKLKHAFDFRSYR